MSALPALQYSPLFAEPPPQAAPEGGIELTGIVQKVLQKKEENKTEIMKAPSTLRDRAILIGGDVFSVAYLAFQGVQAALPAATTISSVVWLSLFCGMVAGAINIGVGIVSFRQMYEAIKCGDKALAFRFFFDGIFLILIGAVMICVSLSAKIALGSAITFLATNPYALPALFLIISIPMIYEILKNTSAIWAGIDVASKFKLDELKELLGKDIVDWNQALLKQPLQFQIRMREEAAKEVLAKIKADAALQTAFDKKKKDEKKLQSLLIDCGVDVALAKLVVQLWNKEINALLAENRVEDAFQALMIEECSQNMETLQAKMGYEAGIEAFKFVFCLLKEDKEGALEQLPVLEEKIKEWNFAQHVRLGQQIFFVLTFLVSLLIISPKISASAVNTGDNGGMGIGNLIPLGMDIFWPMKNNTVIVIPKVQVGDLMEVPEIPEEQEVSCWTR